MRTATKLFLDLAYGREREALEVLRTRAGIAINRKAFIKQLGSCFPEVAGHPRFAQQTDDVVAAAASALGLEAWGDEWLATAEGRRELERKKTLDALADEQAQQPEQTMRERVGPKVRRLRDPRQRPKWWTRLRSVDGGRSLRMRRMSPEDRGRLAWYLEPLEEQLASTAQLTTDAWSWIELQGNRDSSSGLSDDDRLKVHCALVERRIRAVARQKPEGAEPPLGYSDAIKLAFFLGVGDDVVDLRLRKSLATFEGLRITPKMRTAYADFEFGSPMHEECLLHAHRLGLAEPRGISRDSKLAIGWSWDRFTKDTALLLRYRIPLVLFDDFIESAAGETLQALVMPFPSLRAAACSRCGRLHTFDGLLNHRTDRVCSDH